MANYYCAARSSYFRVTDEDKLRDLIEKVDDAELWEQEIDGQKHFAFGAYAGITEYYDEEEDDLMHDITPDLQELIPDDEVIIIQESGYEKLRYVHAWSVIITKEKIKVLDLTSLSMGEAKKLLGNPDKKIQTTY